MSIKLDSSFSREDLERFLSQFDQRADSLQSQCGDDSANSSPPIGAAIQSKEGLDLIMIQLVQLREALAQNSRLLPAYELKRCQQRLDRLSALIESVRETIEPRKKFVFKKSSTKSQPTNGDKQRSVESNKKAVAQSINDNSRKPTRPSNSMQILNKSDETVDIGVPTGCDLELGHLNDCKVILKGNPDTVRIHDCQRCEIRIGPVSRSIFIYECNETRFWLSCQQLRVHQSRDSDFHVVITSGGIIEQCHNLRLHPLDWTYETMKDDYRSSNLRNDVNLWNQIQDFDWLVVDKPSPNWRAIG